MEEIVDGFLNMNLNDNRVHRKMVLLFRLLNLANHVWRLVSGSRMLPNFAFLCQINLEFQGHGPEIPHLKQLVNRYTHEIQCRSKPRVVCGGRW